MSKADKLHYVVATCIVINDERKFLIAKRSAREKAFPNKWTVPGGKLEPRDYMSRPKDTANCWYQVVEKLLKREVREETNLEITNVRYATSLTFIRPDGVPVVVLSFFADHAGGDVRLSPDLTDYAWVTVEEAKRYELIDGIHEELEIVDKYLKTGKVLEFTQFLK